MLFRSQRAGLDQLWDIGRGGSGGGQGHMDAGRQAGDAARGDAARGDAAGPLGGTARSGSAWEGAAQDGATRDGITRDETTRQTGPARDAGSPRDAGGAADSVQARDARPGLDGDFGPDPLGAPAEFTLTGDIAVSVTSRSLLRLVSPARPRRPAAR